MIIVLGISGSGKSSQCKLLSESGKYRWLSVGELLRGSSQAQQFSTELQAGKMVSDDVVIPMVDEQLLEIGDRPEILLDGYPRSIRQVEHLLGQPELKQSVRRVVHLKVQPSVAEDRLAIRARSDDHDSAIGERHAEYLRTIEAILSDFRQAGVSICEIDGDQPRQVVQQEIIGCINGD